MTRIITKITAAAAIIIAALSATGCKDHSQSDLRLFEPAYYNIPYGSDNVWTEKLNDMPLTLAPFTFSHSVIGDSWTGFVPSRVTDNSITSDWSARPWASSTGGGIGGPGMSYLVVGVDKTESLTDIPAHPSALVRMTYSDEEFTPKMIWITNTAQGLHTMKSGTPDMLPFRNGDWAKVLIVGVKDGKKTSIETVWLARDNQYLGDPEYPYNSLSNGGGWMAIDTKSLGDIDYLYFQMQSNRLDYTPTFVVGGFTYEN